MKKLDVVQMEKLQGAMTWRQCMESGFSKLEGIALLALAGATGGSALLGVAIGSSAACAIIAANT